jgi:hypothetical protein
MIIVLSNPTPAELELLKRLVDEKTYNSLQDTPEPKGNTWISSKVFRKKLEAKGYNCKTSKTRKRIAELYGIRYEVRGRELWFQNELEGIPIKL